MSDPDLVDSIRKLAKSLGVASDNAARKAQKGGRLKRCIRQVDGKDRYHVPTAITEWRHNTDPRQQREVPQAIDASADDKKIVRLVPKADPPPRVPAKPAKRPPPPRPSADVPDPDDEEESIADLTRARMKVELERAQLDLAVTKGDLVSRSLTTALIQTYGRHYRDGMLRLPDKYGPQIAGDLGVDPFECHQVLDKYLRLLFETHIATIDGVAIVFPSGDEGDVE